jgi:hypothetical protein
MSKVIRGASDSTHPAFLQNCVKYLVLPVWYCFALLSMMDGCRAMIAIVSACVKSAANLSSGWGRREAAATGSAGAAALAAGARWAALSVSAPVRLRDRLGEGFTGAI